MQKSDTRSTSPSTSTVEENVDNPSELVSNPLMNRKRKTTNTLFNYIPRKMTNTYQSQLDNSLLRFIYLDCQPFSITEDERLKQFINLLNPNYNLRTKWQIGTSYRTLHCLLLIKVI